MNRTPTVINSLLDVQDSRVGVRDVVGCYKFSVSGGGEDPARNISQQVLEEEKEEEEEEEEEKEKERYTHY